MTLIVTNHNKSDALRGCVWLSGFRVGAGRSWEVAGEVGVVDTGMAGPWDAVLVMAAMPSGGEKCRTP
jgi:hypothetical protein